MSVSRRSFFKAFAAATAGAAMLDIDPEKLLWKPGEKTFFIPETPKVYRPDADGDVFERTLGAPTTGGERLLYGGSRIGKGHSQAGNPVVVDPRATFYLSNRYRVTVSGLNSLNASLEFDSDWQLQHATDISDRTRRMTATEQADLMRQVFYGSRRG